MSLESHQPASNASAVQEPQTRAALAPVWLIILMFVLLYCGAVYFDQNGGWFDSRIYAPYQTYTELESFQPKGGGPDLARGKAVFDTICAACHGPDGKGNQAIGAPNLTDNVWLYGSSEVTIAYGVNNGRHLSGDAEHTPMPSFKSVLGPARINLVGAYVWSLSNKTPAGK